MTLTLREALSVFNLTLKDMGNLDLDLLKEVVGRNYQTSFNSKCKSIKEKMNLQNEALLIILNASSFNGVI